MRKLVHLCAQSVPLRYRRDESSAVHELKARIKALEKKLEERPRIVEKVATPEERPSPKQTSKDRASDGGSPNEGPGLTQAESRVAPLLITFEDGGGDLKAAFEKWDVNSDGRLSVAEVLRPAGLHPRTLPKSRYVTHTTLRSRWPLPPPPAWPAPQLLL